MLYQKNYRHFLRNLISLGSHKILHSILLGYSPGYNVFESVKRLYKKDWFELLHDIQPREWPRIFLMDFLLCISTTQSSLFHQYKKSILSCTILFSNSKFSAKCLLHNIILLVAMTDHVLNLFLTYQNFFSNHNIHNFV